VNRRADVCAEALTWLRTPYHHCADVKGAGVDCAMLLVAVFRSLGLVPATLDPRPYAPAWFLHRDEEQFLGWLQRHGAEVERPQPGDVAVWKFGRCFSHGAIVISSAGDIVHSYREAGMVVRGNLKESSLAVRPVRFWQVNGVEG